MAATKSPFPGMDPFIEAFGLWEDFHSHLIEEIARSLAETAPERYVVRTGERSYVVLAETGQQEARHPFKPDVTLSHKEDALGKSTALAEAPAEAAAVTMRAFIEEPFRETFVEVRSAGRVSELVAAVEVLSPSNKRKGSPGWDEYLRKRQALLLGAAHFIEIDLLRGGQRMPMIDAWPESSYYLLLCRKSAAAVCKVWAAHALSPLPPIPVPLLPPDADLSLSLQPLVEAIYSRYRYARSIDYANASSARLSPQEAQALQAASGGMNLP
jgi:hypothetical protein